MATEAVEVGGGVWIHSEQRLRPGQVVEYRVPRGGVALGVVQHGSGSSALVQNMEGQTLSLQASQILAVLGQSAGGPASEQDLQRLVGAAEGAGQGLLEAAWQACAEGGGQGSTATERRGGGGTYTVPEMADMMLPGTQQQKALEPLYIAHALLSQDTVFFHRLRSCPAAYAPRPPDDVQERRRVQAAGDCAAAHLKRFAEAVSVSAALPKESEPAAEAWLAGEFKNEVEALLDYAQDRPGLSAENARHAVAALAALGAGLTPKAAAEVLYSIGCGLHPVMLPLIRSGVALKPPPPLQRAADSILTSPPADPDAACRQDLTQQRCYTIDDDGTVEVDDAVAAEWQDGDKLKVWVHVADPTRYIALGSELDLEARRRAKTVYLPMLSVSMLPPQLAAGPLSLNLHEESCSFSLWAVLARDGELLDYGATPAMVKPAAKLSYKAADALLDSGADPGIDALWEAAKRRYEVRMRNGAVELGNRDVKVYVEGWGRDHEPEVNITSLAPERTRGMVAELMVLAGEVAGRLGHALGLAMPYRHQPSTDLPSEEQLAHLPPGPCRDRVLRRQMPRSVTMASQPLPHFALGVAAYVQVTSPIRRYLDAVAHYQLKSALRGDAPPWSAVELQPVLDEASLSTRKAMQVERSVTDFWVAQFFATRRAQPFAAMLLADGPGPTPVMLLGLGLEVPANVAPCHPTRAGSTIGVQVSSIEGNQVAFASCDSPPPLPLPTEPTGEQVPLAPCDDDLDLDDGPAPTD